MADELWNVQQVAAYLQVKESTVYSWAQQGQIPAHKDGRNWRFDRAELETWLSEHSQPVVEFEDDAEPS
ncbi:MAG: helix-turn-helix domain-containing protein [Anaerolineae bacterium]|jgi:excisionase family DNA binding protein